MPAPVIRRLQKIFPELPFSEAELHPLNDTYIKKIKKLNIDFYRKIVRQHLMLNMEYAFLVQELKAKFLSEEAINKKELMDQLIAGLRMAEFLEHLYKFYLGVPREEERFRKQQELYRELLKRVGEIGVAPEQGPIDVGFSFSKRVRDTTGDLNLYRLLFTRSKRLLDLVNILGTGSDTYSHFVTTMDKCLDPFLAHLAWSFHTPRLLVNLFLTIKHTIPGFWMRNKEERDLGWTTRLVGQMQRRSFELGDGSVGVFVGIMSLLSPFGAYLTILSFAFDVLWSIRRAFIELGRLFDLRDEYTSMLNETTNPEEHRPIQEHLDTIEKQIKFEWLRLGTHLATTSTTFAIMCATLPILGLNPMVLTAVAVSLIIICLANFVLKYIIDEKRPKDKLEPEDVSSGITKLGLFAKPLEQREVVESDDMELQLKT